MTPDLENQTIRLANGSILNPLIERLLQKRGLIGGETITSFLEPKLAELPSPFSMLDMDIAVTLIEKIIRNSGSIIIWGDYDVDGTTATALLVLFFRSLGVNVEYHIPNRLKDGYGIQKAGLKKITTNNVEKNTLLITVDNGISAFEAIKYAKERGYQVIVTDHHQPTAERVEAEAVINPSQKSCEFGDTTLAGVGVAFYLAIATRSHLTTKGFFNDKIQAPNLKGFLDLVAVGTVADMVPLEKLNRILVKGGFEVLATKSNCGLAALCRACNLDSKFIRSEDISFQLAPKINGAGRLGHADKAVELFLCDDKRLAGNIARDLVKNNEVRRSINISDFVNAQDEVESLGLKDQYSIVVSGSYHVGVAGIVASNLVEKHGKPSIVLCDFGDGTLKGSARSIPGIDLYLALEQCQEALSGFGGHKMAGGMSLDSKNIDTFRQLFEIAIEKQSRHNVFEKSDLFDEDIEIKELFKPEVLRQLHLLEPFGQGNPQPIFRDNQSGFHELALLGKDKNHLRLSFENGNRPIKGVGFGMGELFDLCKSESQKEIYYTPSVNFFKGKRSWQVRVTNIVFDQS